MLSYRFKQPLEIAARWIVGLVFIFSGFVKAVDPLGSAYKFHDYFQALPLNFLQPVALVLALILAAAEFTIGFNLLFRNIHILTSWLLLCFMLFFTAITLWISIEEPVSDCGCFGDAVVLSNWETFFKNIVLMVLSLFIFAQRHNSKRHKNKSFQLIRSSFFTVFALGISFYGLYKLPIIDFRPYKIGANIPEQMSIPEGAQLDEYKTLFLYTKNGVTEQFDESNYPWQDSTWTFVEMQNELITKGYTPPIHGFSLNTEAEGNITSRIIESSAYTFLLIAPRLKVENVLRIKSEIHALQEMCFKNEYSLYLVSSSTGREVSDMVNEFDLPLEIATADEITLKTIVRANPGLIILKEGNVVAKYNAQNMPRAAELSNPLKLTISEGRQTKNQINILTLGLIFGAVFWLFSRMKIE